MKTRNDEPFGVGSSEGFLVFAEKFLEGQENDLRFWNSSPPPLSIKSFSEINRKPCCHQGGTVDRWLGTIT